MQNKIVKTNQELKDFLSKSEVKVKGVLCKGHFNVIHPGHIRYLKHAKEHGNLLIIALISDSELKKNTKNKSFFSIDERAEGLASLNYVDLIVCLTEIDFKTIIKNFSPLTFIMGKEFEVERRDEIKDEIHLVEKYRGEIVFHSGHLTYYSDDLIEENTDSIEQPRWVEFKRILEFYSIDIQSLLDSLKKLKKSKILVIGDTIVDQFIACDAIGMSEEAPVIVLKELSSKEFIGGAAIVSAHTRALGANSIFLSVIGKDSPGRKVESELVSKNIDTILFKDEERPTTFKIRYLVEKQKLFKVSRLDESNISVEMENKILDQIEKIMPNIDGLIVSDFVYGLITPRILDFLINSALKYKVKLFGDLQCSSQIGNICKFKNFHIITPTEREARIALGDNDSGLEKLAMKLIRETEVKNLIITLGSNGCVAYKRNGDNKVISQHFPALCSNPIDVAGAGDALMTAVSLCYSSGFEFFSSVAVGVCAAAITANRIGNIPVTYKEIADYILDKEKKNRILKY